MENNFETPKAEVDQRTIDKMRRELGETIMAALNDDDVVEVMLNPDGLLFEDRHGVGMRQIGTMTEAMASNLLRTVASTLKRGVSVDSPIVEGELLINDARFEGIIAPIVARPSFAIRKKAIKVYTLEDYVSSGTLSAAQYEVLMGHVRARHNILVVGSTGSGKTTLCNAVLHAVSVVDPATRIAIIEDTRELQCPVANVVPMRTTEHIDMTRLLKVCMRMRPDRIAVGEVRDKSALALVKAWNTGHAGGVATVHANSAESGLARIEQLVQEAGVPINKDVIAEAVNCIVSIQRTQSGRRVEQILTVSGVADGDYVLSAS